MKKKPSAVETGEHSIGPTAKAESEGTPPSKKPRVSAVTAKASMGQAGDRCHGEVVQPSAAELAEVPPFFSEMLAELAKCQAQLGGTKNFDGAPRIQHKVQRKDFCSSYTDYEYIYLTILGFARLHVNCEEIVRKNNGKVFTQNPGVQMLEHVCGMTMHGDRDGANNLLRSAPAALLEAFGIAKTRKNGMREFFKDAFDRTADPCLEGRLGRLMEYLEARRPVGAGEAATPPWEDVSLRPLKPGTPARDVVGEHLRVFMGECTWSWSRQQGLEYEAAKTARSEPRCADSFAAVFNAATFEAALIAKGVAAKPEAGRPVQWEAMAEGGSWNAYDEEVSAQIEQGRLRGLRTVEVRSGPRGWKYEIDLVKMVQRNPKTKKERPLRCVERAARAAAAAAPARGLPLQDIRKEIAYFVDLCTLPAAPRGATSTSM